MILEAKNNKPFIHFGFSKQVINIYLNTAVTIWQDKTYNGYNESIDGFIGTVVELGKNKTIVNFNTLGTYNVKMGFVYFDESIILESNEITVNVLPITFASSDIFFNNESITFNNL